MTLPTNASAFIPQKPPMVMIDHIIQCNDNMIVTDFEIKEACILVENHQLSVAGIMENIAQTSAAQIGYTNQDQPVAIGVIGAINDFELFEIPRCGTIIHTEVTEELNLDQAFLLTAKVYCEKRVIASCRMKVFKTNKENE